MDVEVIRSARRKKSASAKLVDGRLVVRLPAHCTADDEERLVADFVGRFERRRAAEPIDLGIRAAKLAAKYQLPEPDSIKWVSNQANRWGSTTPSTRAVRISDRLAGFPTWVIDYVVVHELAHLVEPNHSPAFWELANRYPLVERATGFLIAKGLEADEG